MVSLEYKVPIIIPTPIILTQSLKWGKNYSVSKNVVLLQTESSILKAVSMKLRGSRKEFKSFPLENKAGLIWNNFKIYLLEFKSIL